MNQVTTLLHRGQWIAWVILGFSILSGAFVAPVSWLFEQYDASNPVLDLTAKVVVVQNDQVVIAAHGKKVRSCQYVRLQAYGVDTNGVLYDAQIERIDQYEDKDSKPIGEFDFGTWRIWPKGNAVRMQVFSQYLCGQRMVVQKVLNVPLPR